MMGLQTAIPFINLSISSQYIMWQELSAYRAVGVTSRNTWLSTSVQQKSIVLNGSWTEVGAKLMISVQYLLDLQCDNCAIVAVNIIKTSVPSFSLFWVHCTTDDSFAIQTQKITEITEKSGEIYSWFTVVTSLASVLCLCSTCTPQPKSHHSHVSRCTSTPLEHNALASRQFLRYAHLTFLHISNSCFLTPDLLTPPPLHILT